MEFVDEKSTVALGPGIGTHPETRELVARLGRDLACPMVIDADGINNLAGAGAGLKDAPGPRILTPHPGEMARLVGITTPEVQARRLDLARETAAKFGVTLVLKGAQTVVAAPDGRVWLNSTGNPALASGGTGTCSPASSAVFWPRAWPPGTPPAWASTSTAWPPIFLSAGTGNGE